MAKKKNNWNYFDEEQEENNFEVKDAYGNLLEKGDTVIAITNLKVKGAPDIKKGDKFQKIRFTDDPEVIESGKIVLRTEFFKKV